MALKCILLATLVGACSAGVISSPLALAVDAEYDPHPAYSYAYDVQDALTGDSKRQQESRDGDVVRGSYSLNDPDGTRRTVDYAADPVNGFNAVVRREPQTSVTIATPGAAPLTVAPLAGAQLAAQLAAPALGLPALAVSSTSSSRVDAPSGLSVAVPRLISAGSPFVSAGVQQLQLHQLQQLQHLHQLQPQQQLQQLHHLQPQQLVNPLALATNLGLAGLAGPWA